LRMCVFCQYYAINLGRTPAMGECHVLSIRSRLTRLY
jgi:hypothetical protein